MSGKRGRGPGNMADNMTAGKTDATKSDLREADVVAYLRRNPRILLNNPDLLGALAPDTRFEAETVVEDVFRELADGDRKMLPNAGEIHETEIHGADVLLTTKSEHFLRLHSFDLRLVDTKSRGVSS